MPFEIRTNYEAEYCAVMYTGAVTTADRLRALNEVFDKAETTGIRRVLVALGEAELEAQDFDSSNELASLLARRTVGKGARVAYVAKSSAELDQALEELAEARQVPFKRFRHQLPALAWLLAK